MSESERDARRKKKKGAMADLYRDLLWTINSKRQTSAGPKKATEGSGRSNPLLSIKPNTNSSSSSSRYNNDFYLLKNLLLKNSNIKK